MTAELRKVNAKAAGWTWCDLHDAPRWNGPDSCYRSHQGEHVPQTLDVVAPELAAEAAWEIAGDSELPGMWQRADLEGGWADSECSWNPHPEASVENLTHIHGPAVIYSPVCPACCAEWDAVK